MNIEQEKLLSAYVDGELDAETREWVEELLSRGREATLFADAIRRSNKLLQDTYNPVLHQPLPDKLLPKRSKGRFNLLGGPIPLMAAASVVTAVFVGGYLVSEVNTRQELDAIHQKLVELRHHALEYSPSGTPVSWNDSRRQLNLTIEPLKTYRTSDNHYCREYREVVKDHNGETEVRVGIACRSSKSHWDVRNDPEEKTPGTEVKSNRKNAKVLL